jgi:RNA polymerase sigma factor (sigma-70 family)
MKRTDEQLIEDCIAGDGTAWTALIERYQKLVYSIPFRYRLPPEEAADIFQGVWVDLYRGLSSLQRASGLRSWLITATMRRCLLHKRRRERLGWQPVESAGPVADPGPDPQTLREEAERNQAIREVVDSLPLRCRELVRMLFFEQPPLPYAEVARRLGLAEGSIGFIRGRCLERLRKALSKELSGLDD